MPEVDEAKRSRILDAAAQAFAEKGYRGTTMRDISTRAGVADGTIYNHVGDKATLLEGVLARLVAQAEHAATGLGALPADPVERVARLLRAASVDAADEDLFRVLLTEALADPDLARRFDEGLLRPMAALAVDTGLTRDGRLAMMVVVLGLRMGASLGLGRADLDTLARALVQGVIQD